MTDIDTGTKGSRSAPIAEASGAPLVERILRPFQQFVATEPGLAVGKAIGIYFAARAAVMSHAAALPTNVGWRHIFGVSWLGGIGFTMSLFVATLAFCPGALLDSAKVGILGASIGAGFVGGALLRRT